MNNLLLLLGLIFASVCLMVVLGERFATPASAGAAARWQRWLMPLVGLTLVLSVIKHYV